MGLLSPLGIGREATAEALQAGRANVGVPKLFDASLYEMQAAGEVPDFDPKAHVETPKTYLDRCSALTLAACYLAVRDAGLGWRDVAPERRSLTHGTACGCLDSLLKVTAKIQQDGLKAASPMIFTHALVNSPASLAAIEYSVRGPAPTFACGPLAGGEALVYGADLVAAGDVDFCMAGGAEAMSEALYAAIDDAGGPVGASAVAEGAVMLVLETPEKAEARGATALGLIVGAALAENVDEAVKAAGGEGAEMWEPPVDWGYAMGAELPLRVAVAVMTAAGKRVAVTLKTGFGAAAVVVEVAL
jgi:3-oxoacyl-[acyl-carrier-protein] synthase II